MASDRPVSDEICEEQVEITVLRDGAATVVDTTDMRPLLERHFLIAAHTGLNFFVVSLGFKYGLLRYMDLVFDVRFLQNPYYEKKLRSLSDRGPEVAEFIRSDDGFRAFLGTLNNMLSSLFRRYVAGVRAT